MRIIVEVAEVMGRKHISAIVKKIIKHIKVKFHIIILQFDIIVLYVRTIYSVNNVLN